MWMAPPIMAKDTHGSLLVVTQEDSTVSAIDPASLTQTALINEGDAPPLEIAVSPDGPARMSNVERSNRTESPAFARPSPAGPAYA